MTTPLTPAAVVADLAGTRPLWAKAVLAVGLFDLAQLFVMSVALNAMEPRAAVRGLDFTFMALGGMLLWWVWNGSARARMGLTAYHLAGLVLTGLPWMLSGEKPEWAWHMTMGTLLSLLMLYLLWRPGLTYWLGQANMRRKALSTEAQKKLVRFNAGLGLAWLLTPLAVLKVSSGQLSLLGALIIGSPAMAAGAAVLLAQAYAAWQLTRASR